MKKTIKDYKKEIEELKKAFQNLQNELCEKSIRIGDLKTENTQLQNKIVGLQDVNDFNNRQFDKKCEELALLKSQLKGVKQAISLFAGTTKVECEENQVEIEQRNLCEHL